MATHISVVIPCFDEAIAIMENINALDGYLSRSNREYEIIAVNDGSKDHTLIALEAAKSQVMSFSVLDNGRNRGKGFSVRKGILHAQGEVVLFTDADLSTPPEEIERALEILETTDADVVIGSRMAQGANIEERQPLFRIVMGRVFSFLIHCIIGLWDIKDTQCGFKVFRREVAQRIFSLQTIDRFAFDVEILYLARRMRYRIHEMPVTWRNRADSTVDPVKDSIRMLRDVLRIRFIHRNVPRS